MSQSFVIDDAEHFTVGTVGEPGRRVFMVQVAGNGQAFTLKIEKEHAAAIATYLGEMLNDLPSPGHLPEDMELRPPLEIAWAVSSFTAEWREAFDRLALTFNEEPGSDDPDLPGDNLGAIGQVMVTREQASAFAIRATSLVVAGRPPCPLCGYPLDPDGHACPRTNGHRPPTL